MSRMLRVIHRLIIDTLDDPGDSLDDTGHSLDGPGDDDLGGMPDIAGFDLGPRK